MKKMYKILQKKKISTYFFDNRKKCLILRHQNYIPNVVNFSIGSNFWQWPLIFIISAIIDPPPTTEKMCLENPGNS